MDISRLQIFESGEQSSESNTLLHEAGFNLRPWNSNNENLPNIAIQEKAEDEDQTVKILGMRWNTKSDNFIYNQLTLTKNDDIPLTKRELLRQSSKIVDPLGLISPFIVTSKLFMQKLYLWKENVNWDGLLTPTLKEEWKSIAVEIEEATKTEVSVN
ncbi:unnamed protein product [Mytilus coruscus]|uniref:Uncharacterized protein n=1 Tax=Mytilus coruscus TaxID=42192 RepID=A0A6J8DEG4_MYTCO|nr:unnamed protein product [Mytilus coruscus]